MLLNLLLSACNAFTVHIAAGQGFQQTVSDLQSEYVVKRFPIKSSKTVTVKFTKLSSEPADPGLCFVKTHEVKSILFDMGETVPSLENEIKKNRERERMETTSPSPSTRSLSPLPLSIPLSPAAYPVLCLPHRLCSMLSTKLVIHSKFEPLCTT